MKFENQDHFSHLWWKKPLNLWITVESVQTSSTAFSTRNQQPATERLFLRWEGGDCSSNTSM